MSRSRTVDGRGVKERLADACQLAVDGCCSDTVTETPVAIAGQCIESAVPERSETTMATRYHMIAMRIIEPPEGSP